MTEPVREFDERKSAMVLECARLFRRQSYQGTSMADVASVADMNKGTIYYYFQSKADILSTVYMEGLSALDAAISEIPEGLPPDVALAATVRVIVQTITLHPDIVAVYFQEHPWLEHALPADQAKAIRLRERAFENRIRTLIESCVREHIFRHVNVDVLTMQVLSMTSSFYRWSSDMQLQPSELIADTLISNLFDGVRMRSDSGNRSPGAG